MATWNQTQPDVADAPPRVLEYSYSPSFSLHFTGLPHILGLAWSQTVIHASSLHCPHKRWRHEERYIGWGKYVLRPSLLRGSKFIVSILWYLKKIGFNRYCSRATHFLQWGHITCGEAWQTSQIIHPAFRRLGLLLSTKRAFHYGMVGPGPARE